MDFSSLEKELKNALSGDVRFDSITRTIYSFDASIYELKPLGVVFPKTTEDIVHTIRIAAQENVPIIPRGAATGITGGCLGEGIILDLSKYLNKIIHIDPDNLTITCEPGVVQDDLNAAVEKYNLRLGPDTSTGNRATIGGMLANNSAGARSLKYGTMADHILQTQLILADGSNVNLQSVTINEWEKLTKAQDPLGKIYATCWQLRESLAGEINNKFPPLPRRVSGYNFPHLLDNKEFNICRLIAGSEGTLGVASEITLKLSPRPTRQKICLIPFESLEEAFQEVTEILRLQPLALELIDDTIMEAGKSSPALKGKLDWLQKIPKALLVVEFEGNTSDQKVHELAHKYSGKSTIFEDPLKMNQVWNLRKSGLGLLMSKRSNTRAIAFIEDLSVPPQYLAEFMKEFLQLLDATTKRAGIYGHVGAGCMHIRPYLDIHSEEDRKTMNTLIQRTTHLVMKYHGALSGEHGDGMVRTWLNEILFGEKIYAGFVRFKEAFDPHHRMNPNKIVNGQPFLENLRKELKNPPQTFLDFTPEGGINLAVDLCNGNGLCRKKEGVMCPSFQATNDEKDSTRARANTLKEFMSGQNNGNGMAAEEIHQILDLCLSCKGCKTECPSQVDMAKLKAEALHQYQQKNGTSLRSKLLGNIGRLFSLSSILPRISNKILVSKLGKKLFSMIGIAEDRPFPLLAENTFDNWVKKNSKSTTNPTVILFNDTFTNFNHPHIGIAAYQLLQKLDYNIIVPSWKCCGRPALSKGMLQNAKLSAESLIESIKEYPHLPIVFLEPSCWSALADDYKDLIHVEFNNLFLLEEFLLLQENLSKLQTNFHSAISDVAIHIHCHQKSLNGIQTTYQLLKSFSNLKPKIIETGCCGMAGSFGYEKEHAELSLKIGNLKLFPAVNALDTQIPIIANGISCRSQIFEGTGREVVHLAEFFNNNLTSEAIV